MPHIVLLRHAQASFYGESYDALSEVGHRQASALGEHWATTGVTYDRVFVGPLRRHAETWRAIAGAYRDADRPLPEAHIVPFLDEHHGVQVVAHALGRGTHHAGAMQSQRNTGPVDPQELRREYFARFREVLLRWAAGDLEVPGVETFADFRSRASSVLDLLQAEGSGRVLAVSSGGLAAMVVGSLLGLDDERVIDLNLLLRNCATTEFLVSGSRRSLLCFNALPPAVALVAETFV